MTEMSSLAEWPLLGSSYGLFVLAISGTTALGLSTCSSPLDRLLWFHFCYSAMVVMAHCVDMIERRPCTVLVLVCGIAIDTHALRPHEDSRQCYAIGIVIPT